MQVLALLWHLSSQQEVTSGGLRRFIEVLRKAKENGINYTVIENQPSLRCSINELDYESIEFHIPLSRYEDLLLFRLLVWLYATIKMTVIGISIGKRRNFDLVMTPDGELFCMSFPAYLIHIITKTPLILILQQVPGGIPSEGVTQEYWRYKSYGLGRALALSISFYAVITRIVLVKLYNKVTMLIAVSDSLRKQLKAYGVKTKINVLGNGIDLKSIDAVTYKGEKKYDAIFVGRHSPEKGIFDLIEVWRMVTRRLPSAVLVLVGYSTKNILEAINRKIREYNLEKNIFIRGVVSEKEKVLLMKQSKLFVYLSKQEAAPLTPAEALACGLPIICYDILPMKELYNCNCVIYAKTGDINMASRKVLNLLLNGQMRVKLSKIGYKSVKKLDWRTVAENEFQVYRTLIL